MKIQILTTTS